MDESTQLGVAHVFVHAHFGAGKTHVPLEACLRLMSPRDRKWPWEPTGVLRRLMAFFRGLFHAIRVLRWMLFHYCGLGPGAPPDFHEHPFAERKWFRPSVIRRAPPRAVPFLFS